MSFQDSPAQLKCRSFAEVIEVGCGQEHLPKMTLLRINENLLIYPKALFLNTQMPLSPSSSEKSML